jgi:hypothetical protein
MTTDSALLDFQSRFVALLLAPAGAMPATGIGADPGFGVYRNTIRRGAIDALVANHPSVATLVGEDWLRGAAALFVEQHWPLRPVLLDYGAGFADFLSGFEPAATMPYLPAVAACDRMWTESHLAADAAVLTLASATGLGTALFGMKLNMHPAARWRWFDAQPAHALWSHSRRGEPIPDGLAWQGEGVLITRPDGAVHAQLLSRAGCALLDACATGATLGEAMPPMPMDTAAEQAALLHQLIIAGALAALRDDPAGDA